MSQDRAVDEGLHEIASHHRTRNSLALALVLEDKAAEVVGIAGEIGLEGN